MKEPPAWHARTRRPSSPASRRSRPRTTLTTSFTSTRTSSPPGRALLEDAHLPLQAQVVPDRTVLDRAPVGVPPHEMAHAPLDATPGPRDAQQLALMGSRHGPDADAHVAVDCHVRDLEPRVSKRCPESLEHRGLTGRTWCGSGQRRLVHVLIRDEVVEDREVPPVERVFPEATRLVGHVARHVDATLSTSTTSAEAGRWRLPTAPVRAAKMRAR